MEKLPDGSASFLLFFAFVIIIVPFIFYLITLQNTLKAIAIENRRMKPSQVWLIFIPVFGLFWNFLMVSRISESIKAESLLRDFEIAETRPGYTVGLSMCVLSCISISPKVFGIFSSIAFLIFIICWIIYWVKIASYKKQIINSNIFTLDAETSHSSAK